jgi:hypothetical protein
MVFKMTHLRIYGRQVIARYFQLVRISYQKLDFRGISRFFAVLIIYLFIYLSVVNGLMSN